MVNSQQCTSAILGLRHLGCAFNAIPERPVNLWWRTRILDLRNLCLQWQKMGTLWCTLSRGWRNQRMQAQNEMRTLCCTLILGWRNQGLAVPAGNANLMVCTRIRGETVE